MDLSIITDIVWYFRENIKTKVARTKPYVGSEFNMMRAGIHADGLLKNEEIYNIFDIVNPTMIDLYVELPYHGTCVPGF
ncbi:MAG: hypothetical protein DRN71_01510 [Candidatus Nanohalarchaeota archaeon]|nr:MAG: hypothetical protein DRN71_01510 [Candidatus Nanohaloarchaeota archaeon]